MDIADKNLNVSLQAIRDLHFVDTIHSDAVLYYQRNNGGKFIFSVL